MHIAAATRCLHRGLGKGWRQLVSGSSFSSHGRVVGGAGCRFFDQRWVSGSSQDSQATPFAGIELGIRPSRESCHVFFFVELFLLLVFRVHTQGGIEGLWGKGKWHGVWVLR